MRFKKLFKVKLPRPILRRFAGTPRPMRWTLKWIVAPVFVITVATGPGTGFAILGGGGTIKFFSRNNKKEQPAPQPTDTAAPAVWTDTLRLHQDILQKTQ